jgi:hypothetical protein
VPVLTAGTGRYSGRGFTYDSGSVEEYFEKMDRIQDIPRLDAEMVALAQRFAYAVFNLRPFHVTSFSWRRIRTISNEYLSASDFVLSARSADELKMAKDLRQFADWVLHSTQPDFMSSQ